ncbi:MAG: TAXI family TRAP transporter solute-binding subunit [Syntrophaceae bacterium]|nr:TAXI family TRAP transporter solute-binding subunit [Syntrophaceae bacterium]
MRKKIFGIVALSVCFLFVVAGSSALAAKPKEVSITAYGVGSQAYIFSAGIAEAVQKVAGIKTNVIPAGTDVGRVLPMRAGEVEFTIVTGATGWFVSHGTGDFAGSVWGPQPIRMAWRGGNLFVGVYTRADSGIKTIADMKGKRAAVVPGSATCTNNVLGPLAFGGLYLDKGDFRTVSFPSHGAAAKAVTEGAVDIYQFGTTGSAPMETAASNHGIHWFDLDPKNEEGWERLWAFSPWAAKALVTRYAGKEKGHPSFHAMVYPYNIWCWDNTSTDTVYEYAKAMWEGYDLYKNVHAELPGWNRETLADFSGCYYPYHAGVVKLLKEKGVWTDKHETFQQTQLDNEKKRMALWKVAQKEAKEKKISLDSPEWGTFWWDKLIAAGLLR